VEFKHDADGDITAIQLISPYEDEPAKPREIQMICRVKFDEKITPSVLLRGVEQALGALEVDELNALEKVIVAPNKKGAIINFVTAKEKK